MPNEKRDRESPRDPELQNEGEGSRSGARRYDEHLKRWVESGEAEHAAEEAKEAVEGPEGDELREAERKGKERSKAPDEPHDWPGKP